MTQGLINFLKERRGYNRIYTAGSSKGGTCALYYGLLNQVTAVFAGACQYHVGNYLTIPAHYPIFKAMMFKEESRVKDDVDVTDAKEILNLKLKNLIKCSQNNNTAIHLVYSKVEKQHTWQDDMADLVDDLRNQGFECFEKEEYFLEHGEIGHFFSKYVNDYFSKNDIQHV